MCPVGDEVEPLGRGEVYSAAGVSDEMQESEQGRRVGIAETSAGVGFLPSGFE
jgi:hypothetical protein